jgi:hypothetical protein
MIYNYDTIKHNINVYNEALKEFPVLRDYEIGNLTKNSLSVFGLSEFADFCDFLKSCKSKNIEPIMFITFRDLKNKIVESTKNERLSKLMSNKSQPKFKQLLSNGESYDKLLNGVWHRKPRYTRSGRISQGIRKNEKVDGLSAHSVELMNWVIINSVPVYENSSKDFNKFDSQYNIYQSTQWYTHKKLKLDNVPIREMNITNDLLNSFVNNMDQTKVDFRKLNVDFLINNISDRIRKLMSVSSGTMLKSIVDLEDSYGRKCLTKDVSYRVHSSTINSGFVKIYITDDRGNSNYYPYSNFEDMQFHRNDLLDQLFS